MQRFATDRDRQTKQTCWGRGWDILQSAKGGAYEDICLGFKIYKKDLEITSLSTIRTFLTQYHFIGNILLAAWNRSRPLILVLSAFAHFGLVYLMCLIFVKKLPIFGQG